MSSHTPDACASVNISDNVLESLVFKLADNGIFGDGKCVKVIFKEDIDKGAQFASEISFAMVIYNNGNENVDIPILIKYFPVLRSELSHIMYNSNIFWNEVYMYNSVLPFLEVEKLRLFPKIFYGTFSLNNDFSKEIIILEDLTYQNFKIAKNKLFIDYDHIILAVKKLAEFHAMSHMKKKEDPGKFYSIVENLIESKFCSDFEPVKRFFSLSIIRTINLLLEEQNDNTILYKIKEKFININEVAKCLLKPEEPYAVLCHGDFCHNNILYKYNELDKPIDLKFFDLQNSLYTNPSIDLSFLLYLNTTAELRNEYWYIFLEIYWCTLSKILPNIEFTFKEFLEHFSKNAIYALIPASFFIPIINENIAPFKEAFYDPPEMRDQKVLNVGNEETCKILCEMAKHMFDNKYFHKFLEFSDEVNV